MKKITILFTSILLTLNCFAQKQDISLKLKKGETYYQNLNADMNMVQTINEQDLEIDMGMNAKLAFKVLSVVDDIFELEVSYQRLGMKMGMKGVNMEFDSEKNDTSDVQSKLLNAMKKYSFTFKMSKSGKVTEVNNIERIFNAMNEVKGMTDAQKEEMKNMLSKSYGEKAFRANIEMSMAIYPPTPIKVGETWMISGKLESGIAANVETVYTLKEVNDEFYLITGNAKITSLKTDDYIKSGGMEMKYELTGTIVSEIKMNKKTGWIMNGNVDQLISGNTLIKERDQIPDGLTIPLKMKNKMIVTAN